MEIRVAPTSELGAAERDEIRAVLVAAFGGYFSDDDWGHALGGRHVCAREAGAVVAHAALVGRAFEAGGRRFRAGYVEAVATVPGRQGDGLGSAVMARVGELVRHGYELGALATGRHGFYERLGWERWRRPTAVRRGSAPVPTPEGDGAVMVLRHGPSAGLPLDLVLTCDPRPGDPW